MQTQGIYVVAFAKRIAFIVAVCAPLLATAQGTANEGLAQLKALDARLSQKMADTTRIRLLKDASDIATQTDRSLIGKYMEPLLPLAKKKRR